MWRRGVILWAVATVAACGIAETKPPPEPTVEYLPCSGMENGGAERVDPLTVLDEISPDLESELWGGSWRAGDEWHVGLTDVGAIDWQVACPRIGDPGLVVHEVPFTLMDLEVWSGAVADRIAAAGDPDLFSRTLMVDAGQHVIEIRAVTVEDAAGIAEGVPLDAWTYGGPVSSGRG